MSEREKLEIHLLGGFQLTFAGQPLAPLASRHARLLLAWLVLHAGRPQPRAVLADLLWPELPESRARRRLSHALWQLQDLLGECAPRRPHLTTPGDAVLFDAESPYVLDVEELERGLDEVDRATSLDGTALRTLRRCVALYGGELLAGSYEPWVLDEQHRLQQRHVTALGHLVEACKQHGNFDEALTIARRLTHEAPLREDAHREVMRLCVLRGQPSQALEQFERCRSVLAEELGTSPSAATVELRDQIATSRTSNATRRSPVERLVSRRLVGRDEERSTLVDQLERVLAGFVGMVFVEGEPGIGKSELLAQAAEDARWRGFTVLWGGCAGPEVPYAAVREALEPQLDAVRVAQLRARLEPVWIREAAKLLPALGPGAGMSPVRPALGGALPSAVDAERMREALARVITGLAQLEPVALLLEDLHRADEDSLELLRAVARTTDPGRLLVVMSFRDVDARADDMVWSGLRAVDRDARPVRIRLEPLTAFETVGLLREVLSTAHVPAGFAEAVHREGGGNPLYVLELLRALRDGGALEVMGVEGLDAVAVPVTDGLRAVIGDRLDHLDDASLAVVRLGAVLGDECWLDALGTGCGLTPVELAQALGELVRRNLLDVDDQRCRFTHAATRRVVLDRLTPEAAQVLNATAADALEASHPDQVEALATHLRLSAQPRRALRYLLLAADRATSLHAYGTAAGHLTIAAELAGRSLVEVAEHAELLLRLESVLDVLGRRDEQAAVLERLLPLVAGDVARTVEVGVRRANHLGLVDRFGEAVSAAEQARALARELGGSGESARALEGRAAIALGRVHSWAGDNERAAAVLQDALPVLDPAGADAMLALVALGTALRFLQRFDEAAAVLDAALAAAETHGDDVARVLALGGLADLRAETGRAAEAVTTHEQAVALARRIGFRHRESVGLVNLGTVRLTRGEPGPALRAYDEAEEVFGSLGNRRGLAMVALNRAWLRHRWLGQQDAAARDASAAHAWFVEVGARGMAAVCLETLAGVARERGDLAAAHEHLDDAFAAARDGSDQRAEVQVSRGRAELALAEGDMDRAQRAASEGLDVARRLGLQDMVADLASLGALAELGRVGGVVSGGSDPAPLRATTSLVEQALDTSAEAHRIRHRLGALAAALGEDEAARAHHVEARRLLDGALTDLDEKLRTDAVAEVSEHRAIVAAADAVAPRPVLLELARADAPRGRALVGDERVRVALEVPPAPSSQDGRRAQLLQVLGQVRALQAEATVADLSGLLDVSPSTVRRDLRALRQAGHDVTTRGTGTG